MLDFLDLELVEFPIGQWVDDAIEWLTDTFAVFFGLLDTAMTDLVGLLHDGLTWAPWPVVTLIFAAVAFWAKGWGLGVFTVVAFMLIEAMPTPGLWNEAMWTLALIVVAAAVAVAIAIPVGIIAARSDTVSTLIRPVLDFMQTLPVFVYLLPAIAFFSIGNSAGLLATLVFAIPPGVRLTELGIRYVDQEVVEAADAYGASPWQKLRGVQLPLALPSIMQGVNQVIMLALSMVVVAALVGADGLGRPVVRGLGQVNLPTMLEGGLAVVVLAIFLDRVTASFKDRATVPS